MALPHYGGNQDYTYLLECYDDSCKVYAKKIKWNKINIGLYIFNALTFTFNTINNIEHWYSIIYGICVIAWIVGAYFITKTIKSNKVTLKANQDLYDETLKIVDYPRYIKDQRTKKLNKLKKANF